jgi:hypothetical protein
MLTSVRTVMNGTQRVAIVVRRIVMTMAIVLFMTIPIDLMLSSIAPTRMNAYSSG